MMRSRPIHTCLSAIGLAIAVLSFPAKAGAGVSSNSNAAMVFSDSGKGRMDRAGAWAGGDRESWTLSSPSCAITITVELDAGSLRYSVSRDGILVLDPSDMGLERSDASFRSGLTWVSASSPTGIDEYYSVPHGKTSALRNHATEQTLEFRNPLGWAIQLIVRAYDDGVAFRYRFPETSSLVRSVADEFTTFRIAANGRAVLQPRWPESMHDIVPTEDPPGSFGGWALPALFDLGHSWVMLAESDVGKSFCAAQLDAGDEVREYRIKLPDNNYGVREPSWTLPWEMPWRAIIVGSDVATIIESDLESHLAGPSQISDTGWIRPGRASWHWWSGAFIGNPSTLHAYVDLAQSMGWEYSLFDADWDDYYSDQEMQEFVQYATARGVGVFLWYNSAGPQNNFTYSPRDRLWDPAIRQEEMDKLVSWGVKGIKVDFFDSEKQIMIQHYLGILEDAAAHELLVCFHGSTPPRDWSRTWPNMMTTEAVRGAEFYKIDPNFSNDAPLHNVEVAFTRNVVGPMDYTPVTFSDNIYPHTTTNAHELALSVVFESGLVHLADSFDSYKAQPQVVQDFLMEVPAAWDEIRFIEGDPSSHVVLARRKGAEWYLGGLNGTGSARGVDIDLAAFGYPGYGGSRISDGSTPRTFSSGPITGTRLIVTMLGRGGFVARFPGSPSAITLMPNGGSGEGGAGSTPVSLDLIQPNPFMSTTRIAYTLSGRSPVSLTVHDATGRRVRTLVDAVRPAGTHVVSWDGLDRGGAPVAAGVYFLHLKAGDHAATCRVQRLK